LNTDRAERERQLFPHAVRTTYCKIRTESYGAFLKASRVAFINENVPKENLMKPKKTLLQYLRQKQGSPDVRSADLCGIDNLVVD